MRNWAEPGLTLPGQAQAAIPLVKDFLAKKDLAAAQKIYQDLAANLGSPDYPLDFEELGPTAQLIIALGNIATVYLEETLNLGQIAEALAFHENLSLLGPSLTARDVRAKATCLMVAGLASRNLAKEAALLFEAFPITADSKVIIKARNLAKAILCHYEPPLGKKGFRRLNFPPKGKLDSVWKQGVKAWRERVLSKFWSRLY
jgi:hypothetical protein